MHDATESVRTNAFCIGDTAAAGACRCFEEEEEGMWRGTMTGETETILRRRTASRPFSSAKGFGVRNVVPPPRVGGGGVAPASRTWRPTVERAVQLPLQEGALEATEGASRRGEVPITQLGVLGVPTGGLLLTL